MTRKFHFQPSNTGDLVAVEVNDNENWYFELYQNYSKVGSVVPAIVLNSNDWVEVTEKPILVTEDGYEVYEVNNIWKVDSNGLNIVENCPCKSNLTTLPERFKFFAYQENAEAYIERNKPKYSDEDLDHIRRVVDEDIDYYVNEHELKGSIMTAIENLRELKNSKND